MKTLQNIDAELSILNARLDELYTLQETSETDEECDSYQPEIDELSTKRYRLEIYRHEARIYHNYQNGAYDGDGDFIS